LKQLLVWDWRGETHVLKEQSHYYDITSCALTSDGALLVSGGDDGKAKVWRRSNGQCIVSFADHLGGITGVATSPATNAFFTASRDGTCRGFDLVRYRNFRVFRPSDACQFSCVAVDASGELLAAGSALTGTITLWSVQTGKIVEELTGHAAPVTSLAFHASGSCLYSGAMDRTLMVWDLFNNAAQQGEALQSRAESVTMTAEVLCVAASLNGHRCALLLLNGECCVYDSAVPTEVEWLKSFPTAGDAAGGWVARIGPKCSNANAHFTTIALTPDGKRVLVGGESRWIALYHAEQGYLLHKWPVTTNADILGVSEQFDFRSVTDAGDLVTDVQLDADDPHVRRRKLLELPGSKHAHFATGKRKTAIVARTMHVAFAGHGRDFVAATTAGLLLFSVDAHREKFAPVALRRELNTRTVTQMLRSDARVVEGLIGALMLQDEALIQEGIRRVPASAAAVVAADGVPTAAFPRLIRSVANALAASDALEHNLNWARHLLLFSREPLFGPLRADEVALALRELHRAVAGYDALRVAFRENASMLQYLSTVVRRRARS